MLHAGCISELSRLWGTAFGGMLSLRSDDITVLDWHTKGYAVTDLDYTMLYLDLIVDSF
jgi:hypothetical protein